MRRVVTTVIVFAVIIGSLLAFSAIRKPKAPAPSAQQIWKDSGVPVSTASATLGDIDVTVSVTGDLAALNTAVLSPKISGRLTSINVREGDRVTRGQAVAVLDQGDAINSLESARASLESAKARLAQAKTNAYVTKVETNATIEQAQASLTSANAKLATAKKPSRSQERMVAQAKVESAKASLDNAEADYKRHERLLNRGAISQSAFDVAKTSYLVAQATYKSAAQELSLIDEGGRTEDITNAQATVESAQAALRNAKANAAQVLVKDKEVLAASASVKQAEAAVAMAKRELENTYVRAPISGVVSARSADPGVVVSPGQTLATIVDPGSVYFKSEISESSLASVKVGQPVSVKIDALAGRTFRGKVAELYPSGSTANRSFTARVTILGSDAGVKPGMFASGDILTGRARNVVLVPKDAVDERKGIVSVFTIDGKKHAKRHMATVVRENGDFAQLNAESGLKPGDAVITQGHSNLQDDQLVEVEGGGNKSDVAN